jgi:hypothetical protein
MTRPVDLWIRGREIHAGDAAAERRIGREVPEHDRGAGRHVREVDDHVGPFGRREQQLLDLHGGGEEPEIAADLPEAQAGAIEREQEEPRVAPVQHAEAIAPLLDLEVRPGAAVHHHHVAEELGVPDGRDITRPATRGVWRERDLQLSPLHALEERARVGVEQRAVGVERAVLDGERDLVVRRPGASPAAGAGPGRTPGSRSAAPPRSR